MTAILLLASACAGSWQIDTATTDSVIKRAANLRDIIMFSPKYF
jgi:hypothetical protein